MPWTPEDWEGLQPATEAGGGAPVAADLTRQVLRRLPGRESLTLGDVGGCLGTADPACAGDFGRVVPVEPGSPGAGSLDVVVALETLEPPSVADLDDLLDDLHGRLTEGGLVLFTLPAASCLDGPAEIRLGRRARTGCPRFHEVELQYRLQRAGFQGIRLRRVTDDAGAARIVAVGVRRANN